MNMYLPTLSLKSVDAMILSMISKPSTTNTAKKSKNLYRKKKINPLALKRQKTPFHHSLLLVVKANEYFPNGD